MPLVKRISFDLRRGETLAVAGESGSGKSFTSLAIMGLQSPPVVRVMLGAITLKGIDLGQGGVPLERAQAPVVADLLDVRVRFDIRSGVLNRDTRRVHAVEGVSLDIRAGETFSLIGESGCGKSTIARAIVGLVPHTGKINVAGQTVGTMTAAARQRLSASAQIVFQDPMASLDKRMTVGDQISEPLLIHGNTDAESRRARAAELMDRVGLTAAQLDNYPHEFSGGQRQRICIARALVPTPKLVTAGESVSALDVSVQARVLDLLRALKNEFGIAMRGISHDMAVVENISDRVAVMYLGQIVEVGRRAQVFGNEQHPYACSLMAAVPVADPMFRRPEVLRLSDVVPNLVRSVRAQVVLHQMTEVSHGHLVAQLT